MLDLEDTQSLHAPAKYDIPAKMDLRLVVDLLCRMDGVLLQEIFTLSAKGVLYELVSCFVQKYADPTEKEVVRSCQIAKCYEFFSGRLQAFELDVLLTECKKLLLCNLEARSNVVRFEPSLRTIFGLACNRFSLVGEGDLSKGETVLRISDAHPTCFAEEVDEAVLSFHDVRDDAQKQQVQLQVQAQDAAAKKDANPRPDSQRRLVWFDFVDAKTAYSVVMYMWIAIHVLLKRLAVVGKYREEHPADVICGETLTVELIRRLTEAFDTFAAALQRAEQRKEAGNQRYNQKAWQEAIREYSKAIELSPPGDDNRYIYYSNRAACFNQVGEYSRAVEDCTLALSYNPRFFKTLYRRAQAYESLGKKALALGDLEQLLMLHPNNLQGRDYYSRISGRELPPLTTPPEAADDGPLEALTAPVEEEDDAEGPEEGGRRRRRQKRRRRRGEAEDDAEDVRPTRSEEGRGTPTPPRPSKQEEEEQRRQAEKARRAQERLAREQARERAERERRAREQQEEERERRERDEREKARRAREQQRREQREREERDRKVKEEKERAQREKEERAAREREERERREREERRERMERKEREKAEREKDRLEREQAERLERQREKERREQERRGKEQAEARAKRGGGGGGGGGGGPSPPRPARATAAAPASPTKAGPAAPPTTAQPLARAPPDALSKSKPKAPAAPDAPPAAASAVAKGGAAAAPRAPRTRPTVNTVRDSGSDSPPVLSPTDAARPEAQDLFLSRFGLGQRPPAPAPAPPARPAAPAPALPPGSFFASPEMSRLSDKRHASGRSGGLSPTAELLDSWPAPGLASHVPSQRTLEQEVAGNTSATAFFTGLDDINPIADALSHLFQAAGIQPTHRPTEPVSSPFDRWSLSGILAPPVATQTLTSNGPGRPPSPRGVSLLDSPSQASPPQPRVDLLGGPTLFQLHPLAHRRLPSDGR